MVQIPCNHILVLIVHHNLLPGPATAQSRLKRCITARTPLALIYFAPFNDESVDHLMGAKSTESLLSALVKTQQQLQLYVGL